VTPLEIPSPRRLVAYPGLTVAYTSWLKQIVADVSCVALGFLIRVVSGPKVAGLEVSSWLILCTFFGALFLACSKRRGELLITEGAGGGRSVLLHYSDRVLDLLVGMAATATLICYSIYTASPDTVAKFHTDHLLYTVPFVFFGLGRYVLLLYRRQRGEDPARVLFTDPGLLLAIRLARVVWPRSRSRTERDAPAGGHATAGSQIGGASPSARTSSTTRRWRTSSIGGARPSSRSIDVMTSGSKPHGRIRAKSERSGATLSASPCQVTSAAPRRRSTRACAARPTRRSRRREIPHRCRSWRLRGTIAAGGRATGADRLAPLRERDDRVGDELPRPVPRRLPAALDPDDRDRQPEDQPLRPAAERDDTFVFTNQDRVAARAFDAARHELLLQGVDARVRAGREGDDARPFTRHVCATSCGVKSIQSHEAKW
jgi:hypothetical protein